MKTIHLPEEARGFKPMRRYGVPIYTPDDDVKALLWLCGLTSGNIVEIGCNFGNTSWLIANAFPLKTVVGLDWADSPMSEAQLGERPNVESIGVCAWDCSNAFFYNSDSSKFDYATHAAGATLVFIDGCHLFQSVKADTERAIKALLNSSGRKFLVWHDFFTHDHEWIGVGKYVMSEVDGRLGTVVHVDGTCVAFMEL